MRFLKAFCSLALALMSLASAHQEFVLRSPTPDTPIELSLDSDPYFARFLVSPNSKLSLETFTDKVFEYIPQDDTLKSGLSFKFGSNIILHNPQSELLFQDTPQWKLIHHDDFEEEPEGWSHTTLSRCGEAKNNFLGGRCYFADASVKYTLKNIPPHSMLKMRANMHFFGEWKGETAYAKINNDIIWSQSYSWCDKVLPWLCKKYGIYACGLDFPDRLAQPIEFYTQHNADEITFTFSSTLTVDPCVASWGIDDFEVYVI